MPSIEISAEIERRLQAVAEEAGKSKEAVANEVLEDHLRELDATNMNLTQVEIERMRHSIAQLDRGEFLTSEEVESKFEHWLADIEAR